MTTTIALAGKGGVGKTTIAALIIKYLTETLNETVLAIDADASSNLNMALGIDLDWTVGDIREDLLVQVKQSLTRGGAAMGTINQGMTKQDYLDYEIRSAISEGTKFDLIAMGRSEGPGCYCAVNHNLREVIDAISRHYRYVVIDNEAGLEHLSRRTTRDVQHLIVVSDPSHRGLVAAERIAAFRRDLAIHIDNAYLVINRLEAELSPSLLERINAIEGVPLLCTIPPDPDISQCDLLGNPLISLSASSPTVRAVNDIMDRILA